MAAFNAFESVSGSQATSGFVNWTDNIGIGGGYSSGWNVFVRGRDCRIITNSNTVLGAVDNKSGKDVSGLAWEGTDGLLTTYITDFPNTSARATGSLRNVVGAADFFQRGDWYGGIIVIANLGISDIENIRLYLSSLVGTTL